MSRLVLPSALLLLAACASTGYQQPADLESNGPMTTFCVANESASAGSIRVWVNEFRAMTVSSGRRQCRRIREVNSAMRVFAESTAGGFAGTTTYQGEIRSTGIRCWSWILRDGSTSEIRLVPCDFSD